MAEAVAANPKIEASRDGLYEYKVGPLNKRSFMSPAASGPRTLQLHDSLPQGHRVCRPQTAGCRCHSAHGAMVWLLPVAAVRCSCRRYKMVGV
jgi:hypothetical protein